jgi:hypothetical protein
VDYALKNYPTAKAQAERKAASEKPEKPAKGRKP